MNQSETKALTRRHFLTLMAVCCLGFLSSFSGGLFYLFRSRSKDEEFSSYLGHLFMNKNSVVVLGYPYLRMHPQEKNKKMLMKQLFGTLSPDSPFDFIDQHINQKHLDDLKNGRSVVVNEWVLSQTEARLYGLATLMGKSSLPFVVPSYRSRL